MTGWKSETKARVRHRTMRQTKCRTEPAEKNYSVEARTSFPYSDESTALKRVLNKKII